MSTPSARAAPSLSAVIASIPEPQPKSITVSPPRSVCSSHRRHKRVVGWLPVPKASPGSSRMLTAAGSGGSCQLGTIHSRGLICCGPNWACVARTQSWSSTRATSNAVSGGSPAAAHASRTHWSIAASAGNSAVRRPSSQPGERAPPGSSNIGFSKAVPAAASATSTLTAPCCSKASLSGSSASVPTTSATLSQWVPDITRWEHAHGVSRSRGRSDHSSRCSLARRSSR